MATRRRLGVASRAAVLVASLAAAAVVVRSREGELAGSVGVLEGLRWGVLPWAVALELASIVAAGFLQQGLLAVGDVEVPLPWSVGLSFAGFAVANTLPAGAGFAAAFAFRQYRRMGADELLSAWVLVAVAVISGISLAVLGAVGLAVSFQAAQSLDLVVVLLAALPLALAAGLAARRPAPTLRILARAWARVRSVVRRRPVDGHALGARWAAKAQEVQPDRRAVLVAAGWATANWLLDCGALAAAFTALGAPVPWRGLLLAYAGGQLAANLPITPGGLGVVEGSLTVALVAFGGAQATTVAAVLLYRLLSYWGLIAVGWPCAAGFLFRGRRDAALAGPPDADADADAVVA